MRIAVCVRQVPAREGQPRLDAAGGWTCGPDAGFQLNEPDAYALEAGLRLRDVYGGEVVACAAGPARAAQVLREALARGADRAVHVEHDGLAAADAFAVASALSGALREETVDLVLTGPQSDDQGAAATGVVLAVRLGLPHATMVTDVRLAGAGLRVKRELEGGWFQWVALPLPAVLAVQTGINQLRYATLKGIMAARGKEIRTIRPAVIDRSRQRIVALRAPVKTKQTLMLAGPPAEAARNLVRKLRELGLAPV